MKPIKVAIIGYGNVGCYAFDCVMEEPDMELVGIVEVSKSQFQNQRFERIRQMKLNQTRVVEDISLLDEFDVGLLCLPSRKVPEMAKKLLESGYNVVDSFDIHDEIIKLRNELDEIAKMNNCVAITSAGWDPGIDSVIRGWFLAMTPRGITTTNYGPGMSMGHTCAVKAIKGVKDAIAITVPAGMGIHRRLVYVELEDNADFENIKGQILNDNYFKNDRTYVYQVTDVQQLIDMGHGVLLERKGVAGITHNQLLKFEMRINNPAITAQVMVSAARASVKQKPGCYTLIEIPVIDFLYGDPDDFIKRFV